MVCSALVGLAVQPGASSTHPSCHFPTKVPVSSFGKFLPEPSSSIRLDTSVSVFEILLQDSHCSNWRLGAGRWIDWGHRKPPVLLRQFYHLLLPSLHREGGRGDDVGDLAHVSHVPTRLGFQDERAHIRGVREGARPCRHCTSLQEAAAQRLPQPHLLPRGGGEEGVDDAKVPRIRSHTRPTPVPACLVSKDGGLHCRHTGSLA
mmetsp:Transcript_16105/g.32248  ORF Transcript_16105/g.32248 Transcript_16105/m.32248 type:complete len:204 (-) Transcript_16105:578-1189(-)